GAIEEAIMKGLAKEGKNPTDGPSLALIADERDPGKPRLVVFLIGDETQEEINDLLKSTGFSRLVKVSEVRKIEEIPLMGTGKTDYRRLQGMIA
ncbi:MAG TPA: hypothetical protein VGO47_00780, partial [Chlamydiales bacterium]|nr:hypothetical protein [Chlamydiales bacterium]